MLDHSAGDRRDSTAASFILRCMKLTEERGAYHVLALRLRENDAEFRATASLKELHDYQLLRDSANRAFAHERKPAGAAFSNLIIPSIGCSLRAAS
ncbi:hypothetical protein SAMN05216228_105813 [Rhizobium tibeticum]|uniref:Uncharacterized protein n=1 Tax=Rhizobium tibeticum TaxID=501024 RepID=A0A1H8W910_9HYPH|nr:hypothetical protein RTCCBAU85039_6412 [Rhizobium tibeticum]SEP24109.1 hypothetical protein SAMN05216228_105813 [Rhizobium tibeticum]